MTGGGICVEREILRNLDINSKFVFFLFLELLIPITIFGVD